MALILNRRLQPLRGLVDLAPALNVILLLLCFFLLSSSFVLQPGIKVELPHSPFAVGTPATRLIVAVTLAPQQFDDKGAPLPRQPVLYFNRPDRHCRRSAHRAGRAAAQPPHAHAGREGGQGSAAGYDQQHHRRRRQPLLGQHRHAARRRRGGALKRGDENHGERSRDSRSDRCFGRRAGPSARARPGHADPRAAPAVDRLRAPAAAAPRPLHLPGRGPARAGLLLPAHRQFGRGAAPPAAHARLGRLSAGARRRWLAPPTRSGTA